MKTILITGANRGIGLEFAKQYYLAGWNVIACSRDLSKVDKLRAIASTNERLSICQLDVSNNSEIDQLARQLANQPIDILINNAGTIGSREVAFGHLEFTPWLETFTINSIAPVLVSQGFTKHVANSETKIIVNISSTLGSIASANDANYFYYRSSKAALNMATKCMAAALKPEGITVIALHPGWVKTDMGGENAQISPEQSVNGMRKVVSTLTLANSGSYFTYEGKELPW